MIYHIAHIENWLQSIKSNKYVPEDFSNDGFIHCSKKEQIVDVANRYYRGQKDLIILEIDEKKLTSNVVYENLIGGKELFPHIYGPLNIEAVVNTCSISLKESDLLIFPIEWKKL